MSIRTQSALALQPLVARHTQQPHSHQLKALPSALVTAAGLSLGLFGTAAQAATIVVNNGGDTASASVCILRDAMKFMSGGSISGTTGCTNTGGAFGTADTITFGNAVATINLTDGSALYGVFNATQSLLIQGTGQGGITITRPSPSGGLIYHYGGDLTLDGITLTGGRQNSGGAVFINIRGPNTKFQLKNSVITGNSAGFAGAGIYVSPVSNAVATVNITNSTISNNAGYGSSIDGAGIYLGGASTLTMTGSTLSNNGEITTLRGGGIYAGYASTVSLTNSTLSNNVSNCDGAGLYVERYGAAQAQVTMISSTIAFNATRYSACINGGGLSQYGGSLTLSNSIVAGNTHIGNPADIRSTVSLAVLGTNNLVQNVSAAVTFTNAAPLTSDPLLGPLQNNGGPTLTHALLTGSPAINAGGSTALTTDQRGTGFQRVVGSAVDIGAFEVPINGACGPASSSTPVLAKPTTNLCSTGTATVVAGPQPYTWGCNGIGGGSTSTSATACSVPLQQWTVTPFVSTGPASGSISPNTAQTVFQNAAASFTLTPMSGYAAGTATGCNGTLVGATYTTGSVTGNCNVIASFTLTPINGACGSASSSSPALSAPTANLCSVGIATAVAGTGPWTWGCNGNATGSNAACTVAARAGLTLLGNSVVIPGGAPNPLVLNGSDFGSVTVGQIITRSFVINNNGALPLTVNGLSFVGTHAVDFMVTSPTVFPVSVATGQNLNFTVRFTPSAPGLRSATLAISADDGVASGASPQQLKALVATGFAVQGVGVAPVPTVGWLGLMTGLLGLLAAGLVSLRGSGSKRER